MTDADLPADVRAALDAVRAAEHEQSEVDKLAAAAAIVRWRAVAELVRVAGSQVAAARLLSIKQPTVAGMLARLDALPGDAGVSGT